MKIALVCTQGGHLTEILQLVEAFQEHEFFFATHHSPRDGDLAQIGRAYFCEPINARPIVLLKTFPWALKIIQQERPDVVFSSGAEIALPFFFWAKILRIKTIYLESWCRVQDLSLTGKIVYPFVDAFYVQWPQLAHRNRGKAQFHGAVV